MCDTDFDHCVVWKKSFPVARKQHKCTECDLPIPVGEKHLKVNSIFERGDTPSVDRVHMGCEALKDFIANKICRAEEEAEHNSSPVLRRFPFRFDGQILMGGLGEEISNLNEYSIATAAETEDIRALGFKCELDEHGDIDDADGPREVCEWLWECVQAPYRETAVTL